MRRTVNDLAQERRTVAACLAAVARGAMTLGDETYAYDLDDGRGRLTWNITQAKRLIAVRQAFPTVMEMDREQMALIAARYDYDRAHVSQVDITQPGIAAPYCEHGQVSYILIDGTHRAMRAYQEGARFFVQALTDADSRACLVECPDGMVP